ncbi:MAG: sialidase-1 [Planctomycetota bacterium]|jgi:sialidase-1
MFSGLLPLLLLPLASSTTASDLQLIVSGVVSHAEFEEHRWTREDKHLVGSGIGQMLFSKHLVVTGSFHVEAELSIDRLGGTAAAVMLNEDSMFGLDGVDGRMFVNGHMFGGQLRFVSKQAAPIRAGEPFSLSITRNGDGPVQIAIDDVPVFRFKHSGTIGPFGFSPWKSTLRIASLSLHGRLKRTQAIPSSIDLYKPDEHYATYRVPVLLRTEQDSVLAFAEGRDGLAELAGNDIVVRRSSDGGATFGEVELVAEDGGNSLTNPCVVDLPGAGELLLMFQRYPLGVLPSEIEATPGPSSCRTFLTRSKDEGRSWSKARDMTRTLRWRDEVTTMATGPGIGVVLRHGEHAGRVLMPINQGPIGAWHVFAAYSDDAGQNWELGAPAPVNANTRATELQFVELHDGRVLLNARSVGKIHQRLESISDDGGQNWSRLRPIAAMPDPPCSASLLRYADPTDTSPGLILFANPATRFGRRLGSLYASTDEGESWTMTRRIQRGWFGYCSLARLPDDRIGCLYEADAGRTIRLARIDP